MDELDISSFHRFGTVSLAGMNEEPFIVEPLDTESESQIVDLLRRNLGSYDEAGTILAATFRRMDDLLETYQQDGAIYQTIRDRNSGRFVGGAGLGPLAGLSPAEGIGEIRDLVIDKEFRRQGLGTKLLRACLNSARELGYARIYLETTPKMQNAQRLFRAFQFRAIEDSPQQNRSKKDTAELPCYYLLDQLPPK